MSDIIKLAPEEVYDLIEKRCGKNRDAINFRDVLIAINNRVEPPGSLWYYGNLCTFDSRTHWNLEDDTLEGQTQDCKDFIAKALQ